MPPHNKKFLAQKEKEDRQKRIIIIATISVLVIVFGLIAYGVIDRYVLTPQKTIIKLENQTIRADEFEQQIRWQRRNLIVDIDQILNTFQQLGGTPDIFTYFEQQLMLSVTKLQQPLLVGQEVLQTLTQELILRVEAEKMGIVIDEARIDQEIQEAFGYFANGTPTPAPTRELPESVDRKPTNTPQADDQEDPDPTATPLLIPTEYTEDLFTANFQEFLSGIKNEGISEDTIRNIVKMSVIRQEIREIVTADIDQIQEQVWIRHILVADEETALEVIEKLAAGEDFADLAAEYSLDDINKEQGGDLGWFARGAMVQSFDEAAFALEVGETSGPVQSDFGWHILESLGKDDLLLDPSAYNQLLDKAFAEWLTEKENEYQPIINEEWIKFVPSEPSLPADYLAYIQSLTLEQPQLPLEVPQE